MGLVTTLATHRSSFRPDILLLVTTGFLGAYTTFSSYELDTANLLKIRNLAQELIYWVGSPILGCCCLLLGVESAKRLSPDINRS
jgi:CrcB protein